jgi:hypothetical protein
MNPQQFGDYSRGHSSGTALYTVEATHDHEVEFVLPPTPRSITSSSPTCPAARQLSTFKQTSASPLATNGQYHRLLRAARRCEM